MVMARVHMLQQLGHLQECLAADGAGEGLAIGVWPLLRFHRPAPNLLRGYQHCGRTSSRQLKLSCSVAASSIALYSFTPGGRPVAWACGETCYRVERRQGNLQVVGGRKARPKSLVSFGGAALAVLGAVVLHIFSHNCPVLHCQPRTMSSFLGLLF